MAARTAHGAEEVARRFAEFAASYPALRLYAALARALAEDPATAGLLLEAQPGQANPVLFFAAVHDLVLEHPELPLARWYPTVTGQPVPEGDPYPLFRSTCHEHRGRLAEVIAHRRTQTNEVNRVALLAPLLAAACADVPDRPIALVELGCSAGLLLLLDRYRIAVGGHTYGPAASPVRCGGDVLAGVLPAGPFPPTPPIAARVGLDLDPVDLRDTARRRWLAACLWPDVPERSERFGAATEVWLADPPRTVTSDYLTGLEAEIAALEAPDDAHLVVFHTWSLRYTPRAERPTLAAALARLAAGGRPVSWLSAEPPGGVPGIVRPEPWPPPGTPEAAPDTVLGLRRWRAGGELASVTAGVSHPHGNWLVWLAQ